MRKKIIIFILLLIPINVLGLNYEYKDKYEESDDYIILEERWYKFYEEEKIYTDDYFLENCNPKDYPYRSDEKTTTEGYSKNEVNEKVSGRKITIENKDIYYPLEKVNRIELRDFSKMVIISEIEITYKDELITYQPYCYDCTGHISYGFNNNIYFEYLGYVDHFSTVELNLEDEYDPSDLKVTLYFYNTSSNITLNAYYYDKDVTQKFSYNSNTDNYDYIKFEINTNNLDFVENYIKKYDLVLEESNIKKYKWDEDFVLSINDDKIYKKENIDLYKYVDTYYKYYKVNKKYLNGYFNEAESYIKDENDYITKYLYIEKDNNNDTCNTLENVIEDKKEVNNQTLSNKITNPSTFYKFRYIYIVIISITLLLMGYMLYSLRKE